MLVVFLRGVNVGGHRKFSPAALARDLAALDAVNIGAAGTLVLRTASSQAAARTEILRRLPFEPEVFLCSAAEMRKLAKGNPFAEHADKDINRYVTILAKKPRAVPDLPIKQPGGAEWQVQVIGIAGRFVLSLHRRQGGRLVYPNEVVEKQFAVSATTRNWNTIEAVCAVLDGK